MQLKICGMRDPDNISAVAALAPDYMGFIFFAQSPRFVGSDFCIPDDFPPLIRRTGVFVNAHYEEVLQQANRHALHAIQLHGDETPDECALIRASNLIVIKAVAIGGSVETESLRAYEGAVDYFLFDTKGEKRGGNGVPFSWDVLNEYDGSVPFFLSGGLSAATLANGIPKHPAFAGIDINSGAESAPGVKDITKINAIQKIINAHA